MKNNAQQPQSRGLDAAEQAERTFGEQRQNHDRHHPEAGSRAQFLVRDPADERVKL